MDYFDDHSQIKMFFKCHYCCNTHSHLRLQNCQKNIINNDSFYNHFRLLIELLPNMPMEKIILSIFEKKKFLNLVNAFVEHHMFVTLDIIINKSVGHLKITFSIMNVKM